MFGRSKAESESQKFRERVEDTRRRFEAEVKIRQAQIDAEMRWSDAQYEKVARTTVRVPVCTPTHTYQHEVGAFNLARRVIPEMSRFDLYHPSIFPTDGYMCDADMCLLPEQKEAA